MSTAQVLARATGSILGHSYALGRVLRQHGVRQGPRPRRAPGRNQKREGARAAGPSGRCTRDGGAPPRGGGRPGKVPGHVGGGSLGRPRRSTRRLGLTWSGPRRPAGPTGRASTAPPRVCVPSAGRARCTAGGTRRPVRSPPAPRAYQPHAADCLQPLLARRAGVRCHRARLETRTKELHSAASGRESPARPRAARGEVPPDAQRKQVARPVRGAPRGAAAGADTTREGWRRGGDALLPQRGPLALGSGPGGQGG